MIKILYFARLSETLGLRSEQLELDESCRKVFDLIELLVARGAPFDSAFAEGNNLLIAINQQLADASNELKDQDEVAFFPPVTGG